MKAFFKQREFITAGGVVLLVLIVGLFNTGFIDPSNLARVLNSSVILALLAIGSAIVILTKNIDVSVGSTLALSGIVGATMMRDGFPVWIAVLAVLVVGTILGVINGIGVTYGHVPSIVMTLGTLAAYRGISFLITGGYSIENLPLAYRRIGRIEFLGLPILVWALIVLVIGLAFLMSRTRFGRSFYATGDNAEGAYLVGISTNRVVIIAYAFSGLLAGMAALVFLAQVGSIGNQAGQGIEMRAIAAAVIGGVSLTGGVGTVIGAVLGALFISAATSSLSFLGIPGSWSDTVIGSMLLLALFADSRVRALVSKRRLTARYSALKGDPPPSALDQERPGSEVRS